MTDKPRGRPRSETARQAILTATADLLQEAGYEALTIEGIAARAGSSRQTIYRWWPSRAAVIADAVLAGLLVLPAIVVPNTGVLRRDLKAWITATAGATDDGGPQELTRALAAAAANDRQEAALLYEQVTGPHYELLVARLLAGQAAGQLDARVDPLAVADALIGTVLFRTLATQHPVERLTRVVDALLPPS